MMSSSPLVLLLAVAVAVASVLITVEGAFSADYCSSSLCGSSQHIACGHTGEFAASCPADAQMVQIGTELKAVLVNGHNERRNYVAGGNDPNHSPACRMATMKWNDELAYLAALNVRQCAMNHDACHNTDSFKYSGQNLAWMGYFGEANDTARLLQSIEMWYNEIKDSTMANINAYPSNWAGPVIGHFTAMVSEKSTDVGCAAATYTQPGESYQVYLVACNYARTNIVGVQMYEACDTAATKCLSGPNALYPNLCSTCEKYDPNSL